MPRIGDAEQTTQSRPSDQRTASAVKRQHISASLSYLRVISPRETPGQQPTGSRRDDLMRRPHAWAILGVKNDAVAGPTGHIDHAVHGGAGSWWVRRTDWASRTHRGHNGPAALAWAVTWTRCRTTRYRFPPRRQIQKTSSQRLFRLSPPARPGRHRTQSPCRYRNKPRGNAPL